MRAQRIGLVGPVGCGKTALIESLSRALSARGLAVGVVTNDVYTRVDEEILKATGVLPPEQIVGVATGGCPHAAIRDDPSLNEDAVDRLERERPLNVVFIESGGDNLTAVFTPDLVDTWVFVLDTAGGHKVAGKGGPGIAQAPVLVINKCDIAAAVDTDLDTMMRLAREARGDGPVVQTSTKTGDGIDELIDALYLALRGRNAEGWKALAASEPGHGHHHHHGDHSHGRAAVSR